MLNRIYLNFEFLLNIFILTFLIIIFTTISYFTFSDKVYFVNNWILSSLNLNGGIMFFKDFSFREKLEIALLGNIFLFSLGLLSFTFYKVLKRSTVFTISKKNFDIIFFFNIAVYFFFFFLKKNNLCSDGFFDAVRISSILIISYLFFALNFNHKFFLYFFFYLILIASDIYLYTFKSGNIYIFTVILWSIIFFIFFKNCKIKIFFSIIFLILTLYISGLKIFDKKIDNIKINRLDAISQMKMNNNDLIKTNKKEYEKLKKSISDYDDCIKMSIGNFLKNNSCIYFSNKILLANIDNNYTEYKYKNRFVNFLDNKISFDINFLNYIYVGYVHISIRTNFLEILARQKAFSGLGNNFFEKFTKPSIEEKFLGIKSNLKKDGFLIGQMLGIFDNSIIYAQHKNVINLPYNYEIASIFNYDVINVLIFYFFIYIISVSILILNKNLSKLMEKIITIFLFSIIIMSLIFYENFFSFFIGRLINIYFILFSQLIILITIKYVFSKKKQIF